MKYRYEFSSNYFTIGNCGACPLTYIDTDIDGDYIIRCCVEKCGGDCPLEEIE